MNQLTYFESSLCVESGKKTVRNWKDKILHVTWKTRGFKDKLALKRFPKQFFSFVNLLK